MPAFSATAPGKIILFGEHAVVYQQPGIAVPINQVQAKATVQADIQAPSGQIHIQAPDIGVDANLDELTGQHPFRAAIDLLFNHLGIVQAPAFRLKISSTIPVAAGLGSGAAVSVAILRAVSAFIGHPLPDETISALTYEVEKLYHGTPSGIDNTVITYGRPVYFVKDQTIETFDILTPFSLVIGDTGIGYPTAVSVGDVRKLWQESPEVVNPIFAAIGSISKSARYAIENGKIGQLGPLMNESHDLLRELDVSCKELDALVQAASAAGAMGAKLSGGGRGGNMIALVEDDTIEAVTQALMATGAINTIVTRIGNPS